MSNLIQVSLVVFHAAFLEKLDEFLTKGSFPVVLFLSGDIGAPFPVPRR